MQKAPAAPSLKILSQEAGSSRTYYSIAEVAALLGVSRVSVWRWISSGRLPVSRLGHRTVRVKRDDLLQIVRPSRKGAPTPLPTAMPDEAWSHTRAALARGKEVDSTRSRHDQRGNVVLDRVLDHSIP